MTRPSLYIAATWRPSAGTPVFNVMAARPYVPLTDEGVRSLARQWLEDIAAVEQAKVRPAPEHWVMFDGVCWDDCPGCARDMTGAFPVVAVAR